MSTRNETFEKLVLRRNKFYQLNGRNYKNIILKIFLFNFKYIKLLLIRKNFFSSKTSVNIKFLKKNIFIDILDGNNQNIYLFGILSGKEDSLSRYLLSTLTTNDIFYDIGASYGYYSVLAASIVTNGEVHNFEPNQTVFSFLSKTSLDSKYTKIIPNRIAISDNFGELDFFDFGISQSSSISTLYKETAKESSDTNYQIYKVPVTTLDAYVEDKVRKPTVIKVDIESGEKAFIKGAENFLNKNKPIVILELKLNNEKDITFSFSCIDMMANLGYCANYINNDGTLEPLTRNYLTSDQCKGKSYENCVFIK